MGKKTSDKSDKSTKTFTVAMLAERWHRSHSGVLSLIYSGALKAIDVSANPRNRSTYVIPEAAVLEFEASRTLPPIDSAPAPRRQRVKIVPGSVVEFIQ